LSFFIATGGGTNTAGSALGNGHPGTITQSVATLAVDGAAVVCAGASGTAGVIFFGGGVVTWEAIHNIPTLSDGVDRIDLRVGMHDGAGVAQPTDGVYLEYSLALNASQNYFLCAASGGVRTKTDTGIIAVAGSTRKAIITVNAAGTSVTVTIDGVAGAAAVVANIPTAVGNNTFAANLQLVKALGAAARTVIHDYYNLTQTFTVAR